MKFFSLNFCHLLYVQNYNQPEHAIGFHILIVVIVQTLDFMPSQVAIYIVAI